MTIKTLAAVVGTLAIIVVLFFITKVTTPSRFLAKAGFFDGSNYRRLGRWNRRYWFLGISRRTAAKSRCLSKQFGCCRGWSRSRAEPSVRGRDDDAE